MMAGVGLTASDTVGTAVSTAVGIAKVGSVPSMGGTSAGPQPARPPKIKVMIRATILKANRPLPCVTALKRHRAKIGVPA